MKVQWTSHLKDDDAKDRYKKQVLAAKPVLDRLELLLKEKLKTIDSNEISLDQYYNPGWVGWQAHRNGEKSAIKYILNLIDLDQEAK